jgi:2-polyprenyl-3-methyl-5-hydroxy-6-metoxy-1,4-benzoquinol methylase
MIQNYYTNTRLDIQKHIIGNPLNILEIGCASGSMGREIKEKFPNLNYIGVDFSEDALNIASLYLDKTILFDLNKNDISDLLNKFNNNQNFDYIIFADVLEHLLDPIKYINNLYQYLNMDGKIIISMPNICHYTIIYDLLINRDFKYTEEGILDRTHTKFFTTKSFTRELLNINITNIKYVFQNGNKSKFLSYIFGKWILNYFSRQIIYIIKK